ncbi:MAG TPA: DUF6688 family protein [Alphaproteobacteria bacterium]|nr:DUF6688 family protein [Alphaproteobacteria bacterium]
MIDLITLIGILFAIASVLALPPALKAKSWWQFFVALPFSFFGVVLPLFIFGFSSMMEPEWKGGCIHGWLDCFITGKLALTPPVLLATAALYAVDIFRIENRTARWIIGGIFLGAIVSSICFVFGMVCIGFEGDPLKWWLLVPFYVAVWYSVRSVELIRALGFDFRVPLISLALSLPFWLASWLWSRSLYASLPDQEPPGCFIVTAAGHGHPGFVGRHIRIERNGRSRLVNQQLITFWQFENLWRNFAPCSHRIVRCVYNRVGPLIAARIKSPWLADLTYLAIKPFELIAKIVNAILSRCDKCPQRLLTPSEFRESKIVKIERFLQTMSQTNKSQ